MNALSRGAVAALAVSASTFALAGVSLSGPAHAAATCLGKAVTIDLNVTPDATGTDGDDVILGNATVAYIDGGAGNDVICAGFGTISISGGEGNDQILTRGGGLGGPGNDIIEATTPTNGGSNLEGGPGDDILRGGPHADYFVEGPGNDRIDGRGGQDTVTYGLAPSAVHVDLSGSAPFASGGFGNDRLSSLENIYGSPYDDQLVGSPRSGVIQGRYGNDRLRGGAGNDTLIGGPGNDRIGGEGGSDRIRPDDGDDVVVGGSDGSPDVLTYFGSGAVVIDLALTRPQNTRSEGTDTIRGFEVLIGSDHDDILRGSNRSERIYGSFGNDRINARGGNDRLYGDDGNDYLDGSTGRDRCTGGPGTDVKRSC